MDHYLDLMLRPDPEIAANVLLGALYSKLHRALAYLQRDDIGVSFPSVDNARNGLGTTLRIHGTTHAVHALQATAWLNTMRDHVANSDLQAVPESCRYRGVRRVQAKSNPERLRRRLMKRHGIDAAAAAERIPDTARETLDLPFIRLASASTGQPFLIFIDHGPLQDKATPGRFNSYGLGQGATIPWFRPFFSDR